MLDQGVWEEGWYRSMKNQVLLENYSLPGDLRTHIAEFISFYNASDVMRA